MDELYGSWLSRETSFGASAGPNLFGSVSGLDMDTDTGLVIGKTFWNSPWPAIQGCYPPDLILGSSARTVELVLKLRCTDVGSIFRYGEDSISRLFDCGIFPDGTTFRTSSIEQGFANISPYKPGVGVFHHLVWTYHSEGGVNFFANGEFLADSGGSVPADTYQFEAMTITGTFRRSFHYLVIR